MKVTVIDNQSEVNIDLRLVEEAAAYISDKFDKDESCQANIIFTGREEIRGLNSKYRGVDKATDVLSFSYMYNNPEEQEKKIEQFEKQHGHHIVGEIIICPQVAQENCKERDRWNLDLEIFLLIIHGFLHLYDYDHQSLEDRDKMFDIQDSMLEDVRSKFKL